MSVPDPVHAAALGEQVIKPVFFIWLDIVDDPLRANTSGTDVTPFGTGDDDLDDFEFKGIRADIISVSPVRFKPGGSESVTVELSGLPSLDDDLIEAIDDRSTWQSRDARLWRIVRNASNIQQGGFHGYYTGKITNLRHGGSPTEGMTITCTIEGYLSVFSEASNRTYLDQSRYDPGDESARATIAVANGNYGNARTTTSGGSGSGGGNDGARFNLNEPLT